MDLNPAKNELNNIAEEGNPHIWLISFTDVIALMLTFFVLLYGMTKPIEHRWKEKTGLLPYNLDEYSAPSFYAGQHEGTNISGHDFAEGENLEYLHGIFSESLIDLINANAIYVVKEKDRLIINLSDSFWVGFQNDVKASIDDMARLAKVLARFDNQIDIRSGAVDFDHRKDIFVSLQNVARYFYDQKYKQPIVLGVMPYSINTIEIIVYNHDGRRIIR